MTGLRKRTGGMLSTAEAEESDLDPVPAGVSLRRLREARLLSGRSLFSGLWATDALGHPWLGSSSGGTGRFPLRRLRTV
jgi:hypothetical protein